MNQTLWPLYRGQSIEPAYLPEIRHPTDLQGYTCPYEYYTAGPSRITSEDGFHRCVHCETSGVDETYTYCPNCGRSFITATPKPSSWKESRFVRAVRSPSDSR